MAKDFGMKASVGGASEMLAQNPSETWWHWLYTNAPAAWTSAIVATITLLLVLRTRKRPRRVVVREVSRSSLIRIWPGVRKNIRITFSGDPINTLGQIDVEIYNEGSEFIEQPALSLVLPDETRILGSHTEPEEANAQCQMEKNRLSVRLPHLNPLHEHRQVVSLSVLVDGPITPLRITGGGQGWSIRHRPLPTAKQRHRALVANSAFPIAVMITSFLYISWSNEKFGIGTWEISWRAFYANTPVLILFLIFIGKEIWDLKKRQKRPMSGWGDF
jgi:hypothetical protein